MLMGEDLIHSLLVLSYPFITNSATQANIKTSKEHAPIPVTATSTAVFVVGHGWNGYWKWQIRNSSK
jgi:hypothetical protein